MLARLIIAAILVLATTSTGTAQSMPGVPWPDQAMGRPLPRTDWILAIPARRTADGNLTIWDRDDEWAKAWRVPRTINGIRVVTLFGDSEDRRAVTAQAIDQMLVDDMRPVIEKYGAPALALIVADQQSVAVAGYVPGWQASWAGTFIVSADANTAREAGLNMIAGLFTADPSSAPDPATDLANGVEITAYRTNPQTGGQDYRLRLHGAEIDLEYQLGQLNRLPAGQVVDAWREADGTVGVEVAMPAGAPRLEDQLLALDLTLR